MPSSQQQTEPQTIWKEYTSKHEQRDTEKNGRRERYKIIQRKKKLEKERKKEKQIQKRYRHADRDTEIMDIKENDNIKRSEKDKRKL